MWCTARPWSWLLLALVVCSGCSRRAGTTSPSNHPTSAAQKPSTPPPPTTAAGSPAKEAEAPDAYIVVIDQREVPRGGPLGARGNPVRAAGPSGERAYLARLRCPDGQAPAFERVGSYGRGPHGNIIDGYEVRCGERGDSTLVFIDMYHEGYVERRAIPGYTIVPR